MSLILTLKKYKWLIITILCFILFILNFYLVPAILSIIIADVTKSGFVTMSTKIGEVLDITAILAFYFTALILLPIFYMYVYFQFNDALYTNEKILFKYLDIGLILGYLSIFISYPFITGFMLPFFFKFNSITGILNTVTLSELVSFIISNIILVFCILQIPLLMRGLAKINLVSKKQYKDFRLLYFGLSLFIVTWVTPLDIIATLLFQLPVYSVYEIGILLS
jgi:Sec-independent protein secretion pathway component TatC